MCSEGLTERCKLDKFDLLAYITAGACHDVEHPGLNNVYLMEDSDRIALRYNDQSVLENHHAAKSFEILKNSDCNFTVTFSKSDYKRFRKTMVSAILATDMSKHFEELGAIKSKLQSDDFDATEEKNKMQCCNWMFHLADISNPTKPFAICRQWTDLLFDEFFRQGDLEKRKGFTVSMFMDRVETNIAKS